MELTNESRYRLFGRVTVALLSGPVVQPAFIVVPRRSVDGAAKGYFFPAHWNEVVEEETRYPVNDIMGLAEGKYWVVGEIRWRTE